MKTNKGSCMHASVYYSENIYLSHKINEFPVVMKPKVVYNLKQLKGRKRLINRQRKSKKGRWMTGMKYHKENFAVLNKMETFMLILKGS